MRRYVLLSLLFPLGVLLAWLLQRPAPPRPPIEDTRRVPQPERVVHRPVSSKPELAPIETERPTFPKEAALYHEVHAELAELEGTVHVSCFVGEDLSPLPSVQYGYLSFTTVEREGSRPLLDVDTVSHGEIFWETEPGASTATCTVKRARWAEVDVLVLHEDRSPVHRAGIVGCGSVSETADDGHAAIQVHAETLCILEVRYWSASERQLSSVFHRLRPMQENEVRHLTLTARKSPVEEDGAMPVLDWQGYDAFAPGETFYLPSKPNPWSPQDYANSWHVAYEERIRIQRLLRENVSEEARPIVDEMLRRSTNQAHHWKNELDQMGVELADDRDRLPTP